MKFDVNGFRVKDLEALIPNKLDVAFERMGERKTIAVVRDYSVMEVNAIALV